MVRASLYFLTLATLSACSSLESLPKGQLKIVPRKLELHIVDGEVELTAYRAFIETAEGKTEVTDEAMFALDADLGSFTDNVLVSQASHGGTAKVIATLGQSRAQADLVVFADSYHLGQGVPSNVPKRFADRTANTGGPAIIYPPADVSLPPNLGALDVHWQEPAQADWLEVTVDTKYTTRRIYVLGTAPQWTELRDADWQAIALSGSATLTVSSLRNNEPVKVGESIEIRIVGSAVEGGIYYWASKHETGEQGIYRHDMGDSKNTATPFYTDRQTNGTCVGCHGMSRDGRFMATSVLGSNSVAARMIDVSRAEALYESNADNAWYMAAFLPNNEHFVAANNGNLTLREVTTGAAVAPVQFDGAAYHPAASPTTGDIAFVGTTRDGSDDLYVRNASLFVQPYDGIDFSAAREIAAPVDGSTYHYPDFSPDGAWLMVNRSNGSSYDADSAQLYVVRADGSGIPHALDTVNDAPGQANSWAKWTPFSQQTSDGETFYWFTFSSKRPFGNRASAGPQIWMAPFFPERIGSAHASGPAFRLPFQSLHSGNHVACWSERITPRID